MKSFMMLILVGWFFSCGGSFKKLCPSNIPYQIQAPDGDIQTAIDFWNEYYPFFEVVYDCSGSCIDVSYSTISNPDVVGVAYRWTIGEEIIRCDIVIDPDRKSPYLIAHELGHCLGLVDSIDNSSIMYYKYLGDIWRITADDVHQLDTCLDRLSVEKENNYGTIGT